MAGINRVTVMGRVGRIESKTAQNGTMVTSFSVAWSEKYKNKQGEHVDQTEWFSCVAFQRLAEIIAQYVQKGHMIYVEGPQKTEKYMDKNGVERESKKIIVNNVQFIQQKESSDSGYQKKVQNDYVNKDNHMPFDDEIPF